MRVEVSVNFAKQLLELHPCVNCKTNNHIEASFSLDSPEHQVWCRTCKKETDYYEEMILATKAWNKMNPIVEFKTASRWELIQTRKSNE